MYSAERKSQLTMGCEYRARTGACGCPNAPYGCRKSDTKPSSTAGFKISFPQGVNSYRDLRMGHSSKPANRAPNETNFNDEGIPIGQGSSQSEKGPAAPSAPQAPALPSPLPVEFAVPGWEKTLPAVGWQCTAADAAAAVSSGLRYIDANGDPAAESALGAALASLTHSERQAITVGTVLTASAPGHMRDLAEAAAARMGVSSIGVLCLEWEWDSGDVADNGWDDVGGLEAAWREMAAVHQAGLAKAVGLQCRDAGRARAVLERIVRLCSTSSAPLCRCTMLKTNLHPLVAKVQRNLLGFSRRNRCQMVALEPLGGKNSAVKQLPEVQSADGTSVESVLLAFNVARGVVALPSAAEGATTDLPARHLKPLTANHRAALDDVAPQA